MKHEAIIGIALSALALFGNLGIAHAQADCKTLVKPSPFGPDDQIGATNRITPAVTKAAAAEIQTGAVVPMAYNLVDGVPLFGTRFTKTMLTTFALRSRRRIRQEQTELHGRYLSQPKPCRYAYRRHGPHRHPGLLLQSDADGKICHSERLKKLGLENLKSFATRGVILDMVKVFQEASKLKTNAACRTPCLDGGTVITPADIQAALKMYDVTLREGDAVFIHTGWGDLFKQFPAQNAEL